MEGSGGFFLPNTEMGSLQEILPETDRPAEGFPDQHRLPSDSDENMDHLNHLNKKYCINCEEFAILCPIYE